MPGWPYDVKRPDPKSYYLKTFGCQMNVYDSERMAEAGLRPHRSEGTPAGGWIVLDFGDVLVHIFSEELREFYKLEELWAEAPTLLVVRKEGGLFTDDETVLVNYRVQGNRYIVDTVFDRAILIAGVGSSQDRVTISRRK